MKTKMMFLLTAFLLVFCLTGSASAYMWTDIYDPADDILLNYSNTSLTYTHDITDDGFVPGEDFAFTWDMTVSLYDDGDCDLFKSEWAILDLPGFIADRFVEVDYFDVYTGFSLIGTLSLNSSGLLNVNLTRMMGDFYFGDSTLNVYGCDNATVPEPATILLLGAGLLGVAGLGRKS